MDPPIAPLSLDQIRIRNPKTDDLGDVISDLSTLETQFLYDEKDIYMQVIDPHKTFNFVNDLHKHNCYHILVREWNSDTWDFGPLYEVKVDKNSHANKFSAFLTEHMFPHILAEDLQCSKVGASQIKTFRRGDLILRRWSRLKTQATWLG